MGEKLPETPEHYLVPPNGRPLGSDANSQAPRSLLLVTVDQKGNRHVDVAYNLHLIQQHSLD